ncbi:MAG TPA: hypothetical protein VG293_08785 [Solirubrobacteraceae bacterium]|nr:hypothetical protein [Solirubrobacteraceae bacterium]
MSAGQAHATPLGPWQRVADAGIMNITEVGLARTADGTLHAAWSSQQPGNTQSIELVPISAGGGLGAMQTAVSGWSSTENPALGLSASGALQLFFGGIHSLSPTDPNADENLATSTDGGNTWTLTPADAVAPAASAYASQVAVSNDFAAQATPFETWTGTSGVWVHAGTDSTSPNSNFQTALGGCCGYYAKLASDGSGNTDVAWYSNATGKNGIWAQSVSGGGVPTGSPQQMPNTANLGVGELQRTPLIARQQGGFYVTYPIGYPSFTGVEVWKIGGAALKVRAAHAPLAAGAAVDQAGRVWVFWVSNVGDRPVLYATRSNPSVTAFGATVTVGAPHGTGSVFSVDGNASSGALDVFSTLSASGSPAATIWTRHVYPGLSVAVSPSSARLHHATKVTVHVTDAGVAVKGATVRLGSHKATTNAAGRATIHLTVARNVAATASDAGYVSGSAELFAKR